MRCTNRCFSDRWFQFKQESIITFLLVVDSALQGRPEYPFPNWDALKAIPLYSNEKPFMRPVEAMFGIALMFCAASWCTNSVVDGLSARNTSRAFWMMVFGHSSPALFSIIASLRDFYVWQVRLKVSGHQFLWFLLTDSLFQDLDDTGADKVLIFTKVELPRSCIYATCNYMDMLAIFIIMQDISA